jgi:hypothetical protein
MRLTELQKQQLLREMDDNKLKSFRDNNALPYRVRKAAGNLLALQEQDRIRQNHQR